jgi:hypothetical protein
MDSQSRDDRRGAKQEQPRTVFTKVPDELLLYMLHQMDITEVLSLRETSRFFVNTCTEVMRDKLKVLYVHPSPRSVDRAINICRQPDLSSEVEEICFVSKAPPWQHGLQIKLHPRQWALDTPLDDVDGPVRNFDRSYQHFLSSLAKLKCLQMVSFRESCDRLGLNILSAQHIANWQDTLGNRRGRFKDLDKGSLYEPWLPGTLYATNFKPAPPMAFLSTDVDTLNAVLNSDLNFTHLIIPHELFGNPLPFRTPMYENPVSFAPTV